MEPLGSRWDPTVPSASPDRRINQVHSSFNVKCILSFVFLVLLKNSLLITTMYLNDSVCDSSA